MKELFKQEGYNVIGAAMEVYNQMGSGFLEETNNIIIRKFISAD
jgi:hypothetical protein